MFSTSPTAPSQPAPPDDRELATTSLKLRAEFEAASSSSTQAVLLHEVGVLEEKLGDEPSAAKDHLASVNLDPDYREPLERLVAIIERHQSYKNLGKVLERLARVAETRGERARGLIEQAALLVDHDGDLESARTALLEASEETPDDAAIWLSLELLAARLDDAALAERALSARAELTQDATFRALLLIDLAERRAEHGNVESALDALDRAVANGEKATFLALLSQERLGRRYERLDVLAKSLETQAELLLRAIHDSAGGDAKGVPQGRRTLAHVGDAWLRAADVHQHQDDSERALSLLDRAAKEVPSEPAILQRRLLVAVSKDDNDEAASLAAKQLELGLEGEVGAALWLRILEKARRNEQPDAALEAAQKALALAPRSAPARAAELDLLRASEHGARLATAEEALAEQLADEPAKASTYLLAADTWARLGRDVSGAKAALTQAAMFGAAPALVARVARLLAAVVADPVWYEEATRRLLAQGASEEEQLDLWLELARARALRSDMSGAAAALGSVAGVPGGAWLGNALGAYAVPWLARSAPSEADGNAGASADQQSWSALTSLSELEHDVDAQRALKVMVALRALLAGDTNTAIAKLDDLHQADASDLLATAALSLLLQDRGDTSRARDVLLRAATETSHPDVAAALYIAGGVASWQLGERARAVEALQRAAEDRPEAAASLLGWALRAAEPNDAGARAKTLDALSETDPHLAALERFALEVGHGGSGETAWDGLLTLKGEENELARAAELARALWGLGSDADTTRREALDAIAGRGRDAARLARAALHKLELGQAVADAPDPALVIDSARGWAEVDPSAAPVLEWLAAAIALQDHKQEVEARRALAVRLPEPLRSAVTASALLVGELSGQSAPAAQANDRAPVALANLELAAPGMDPGLRGRALLEARPWLGEESLPIVTAMAGFNQLAAGDVDGAMASFRSVVEAYPSEVIGWEGLRAAATARSDRATLAEASAALGDAVADGSTGARLWEEAATILLDELGDTLRGEFALSRATERDINRFSSFDRLFRMVRARKDGARLLDLIERRLKVAVETPEVVRLLWERARVLREAGDRDGALRALAEVRELEPEHVGALALTGEISITLQRFDEAADNLARLAAHPEAPGQQRLMSAVASADLYENRLKQPERALEVLSALYRAGLSTLPVRERLARTAARVGAYEQATEVLEQLMTERDSAAGRIEAARLAMAIYRDQLGMPEAAQNAVARLLSEAPTDGEALDLALSGAFAESVTRELLERGLNVLVKELTKQPMNRDSVDRLARIAGHLGRLPLRQAALGALVALGAEPRQIDPELLALDERVARLPRIAIDDASLPSLVDAEDGGPIARLMVAIASTVAEALGPSLAALGVGKKERVDPRSGLPLRNEVAAWAGALGIGEFELYVGGNDPLGVCAIATETPALVVGKEVSAPLTPYHRQAVARELFALRRGVSVLRHRGPEEIHALLVAACRVVEVDVPSPAFALLAEFQRQLGREMPRRVKKALPEIAREFSNARVDPASWYRAATSTLDRMAAIAAGDVSWVLASEPRQRGRVTPTSDGQRRAERLLGFVLSPTYLELREKLGMGVR